MNLAALRQYRRQVEDLLRVEVAVLERVLEASVRSCDEAQESANRATEGLSHALSQGLRPPDLFERALEVDGLTAAIRQATLAVGEARQRWEQKRSEAIEASRERKTLDVLDQRRMRVRAIQLRRLEQSALDEAAQTRFLRNFRAGADHEG